MLVLAPEVWKRHGGIQRYMQMIIHILADRREPFAVLSLIDGEKDRPGDAATYSTTCSGNKVKLCMQAFRLARAGAARKLVIGHVGLLPVGLILRWLKLTDDYAVVLHGIEAWEQLPWLQRMAARRASRIIATTFYTAREFCFLNGVDQERCVVIPLAAGISSRPIQRNAPKAELKLLMVSRLSKADHYKGVDTLLEALRLGRTEELALILEIVGAGDDTERLEDLARSLQIRDAVRFRGALPDQEVQRSYDEAHVFVMPSKKEGFGIVFVEAMASGLPCIGANHGGTPEVIEHSETGFLIEYGDAAQMVIYLRALLKSSDLYRTLSRAAHRRATETLGFDSMAKGWNRLVDQLNLTETQEKDVFPLSPGEQSGVASREH
jgi:phosphatidylinositol alpha-1,6-mannosyltransferase